MKDSWLKIQTSVVFFYLAHNPPELLKNKKLNA